MGFESLVQTTPGMFTRVLGMAEALELDLLKIQEIGSSVPRIDEVATYLDVDSGEVVTSVEVSLGGEISSELQSEFLRRTTPKLGSKGVISDLSSMAQYARSLMPGGRISDRLRNLSRAFKLRVSNLGEQPIVIMMGELLSGGYVDRVIAADIVVPPSASGVIEAFCVEGGRVADDQRELTDAAQLAAPSLRRKLVGGNQLPLWAFIAEQLKSVGVPTPRASYCQLSEAPGLHAHLEEARAALPESWPDHALGVALRIDGELVYADAFRDPACFQRSQVRLAASYVLEAALQLHAGAAGHVAIEPLADTIEVSVLDRTPANQCGHTFFFRT